MLYSQIKLNPSATKPVKPKNLTRFILNVLNGLDESLDITQAVFNTLIELSVNLSAGIFCSSNLLLMVLIASGYFGRTVSLSLPS